MATGQPFSDYERLFPILKIYSPFRAFDAVFNPLTELLLAFPQINAPDALPLK